MVLVQRAQAEMQNGRLFDKAPKSAAGVRPVAFPDEIPADGIEHLERSAGAGRDGHVFLGPQGRTAAVRQLPGRLDQGASVNRRQQGDAGT
ncbi:hypothetical protein [Streptomyces atratus]|uniref:hypothetical protein n=1 Tax=Streptomyces atratus TaxID=1893 RepID=UPI00364EA569